MTLDDAPLAGVTVLDLTRWMAGPYAALHLADAGAEVIKVEPPAGESNRHMRPRLTDADGSEISGYFLRLNRRKKSVRIDLKSEEGQAAFKKLALRADVVLENFKPGVMARFGLDYESLKETHPRLVYCAITGFGSTPSRWQNWPAFNAIAEAAGGLVHWDETGEIPSPYGAAVGDLYPASEAVSGILMALLRRHRTGRGSFVDIAMLDAVVALNEMTVTWAEMTGKDFRHGVWGNQNLAPYGFYPAADGFVCIGTATDDQWSKLCEAIGRSELATDPRLLTGADRVANSREVVTPVLAEWLADKKKADAAQFLAGRGVPAAPVQTGLDVLHSPQLEDRQMLEAVQAPGGATWRVPRLPIRFVPDFEPASARVPVLGEDDDLLT